MDPDLPDDRIARATERLRVASERASQAHEHLIVARDRLAQARRALRATEAQDGPGQAMPAERARQLDRLGVRAVLKPSPIEDLLSASTEALAAQGLIHAGTEATSKGDERGTDGRGRTTS